MDAIIVLLLSTLFVGFFIFNEAKPGGSTVTENIRNTIKRFFRKVSLLKNIYLALSVLFTLIIEA